MAAEAALMAAGPAINILGGLVAELMAKGERDKAEALLQQAAKEGQIPVPELERIAAEQLGPSAFESIQIDPRYETAQNAALDKLLEISESGGLTLQEKANMNRLLGQSARANNAANAQVRNNMASRGVGGSGAELAMQLSNNQAAASRNSDIGLDNAARAEQRALDAIMSRGEMAGRVRGQSFDEKSRIAQARDEINRVNMAARERAQYYNAGLGQQDWQNRMTVSQNRGAGLRSLAGMHSNNANGTAQRIGGAAQGAAYGVAQYGMYQNRPQYGQNPYGYYQPQPPPPAQPQSRYVPRDYMGGDYAQGPELMEEDQ